MFAVSVIFATTPGVAEATPGASVAIILVRAPDFSEAGWSVSGAIVDHGAWTTPHGVEIEAKVLFVVAEVLTTQTSALDGSSFGLRFQGREGTAAALPFGGTWQLWHGTGRYTGLTGGGSWSGADNALGEHVFTIIGSVH